MAAPDGKGAKPGDPPRPAADRPEAFGRGEHTQPKADQNAQEQGAAKPGSQGGGEPQKQSGDGKQEDAKQKDPRPFWKRPVLMTVLVGGLLAATVAGIILGVWSYHHETTDDAFIDGRIVRVAARVAGKVIALPVTDNQYVGPDDVLIKIDPEPFQVKVDQMDAALQQANAQADQASANQLVAAANAAQAGADVNVAEANSRNAEQNFQRFNNVSKEARSQQQLDDAIANQKATAATLIAQQKRAASADAQVKAAQTAVEAALAAVQSAKTQLADAKLNLNYCSVRAGYAGRVTRRTVEVGNYVAVQQEVMDVVPTEVLPNDRSDIWVTANFKETQLTHIVRGQRVTITVDAFPDEKLHGHVDSVQNGTGSVFSLLPAENATGNYVKVVQRVPVKILIDDQPRHMLSPGMSVEPDVDISSRPDPDVTATMAPAALSPQPLAPTVPLPVMSTGGAASSALPPAVTQPAN